MIEFDDKQLDELIKKARPFDLTKEEREFIVKSKDEIYKNVLKKTSKFFLLVYGIYLLKKLIGKFIGASVSTKVVSTVIATTVATSPITAPIVKDYLFPDIEEKKIVKEIKAEKKQVILKNTNVFAFQSMIVNASTLNGKSINRIKSIFYSALQSKKKQDFTLQIGANRIKELGIYYGKVKILDNKNVIMYHNRKESKNINEIYTYFKKQARQLAIKYVK